MSAANAAGGGGVVLQSLAFTAKNPHPTLPRKRGRDERASLGRA
jgi:hypothetical protein